MANNTNQLLARQIIQAKQLDPSISLRPEDYYKHIKYFLFGTTETQPAVIENQYPKGGLNAVVKNGKLLAQSKIYIKVKNKSSNEFIVPNIRATDPASIEAIDGNKHFLPSDLVRILTGLARLFLNGDGKYTFNKSGLEKFVDPDPQDLRWVKLWGQSGIPESAKKLGMLAEIKFEEPNAYFVNALVAEIYKAAAEYEQIYKKIDTSEFVPQSEVESASINLIIPQVIKKYNELVFSILKSSQNYETKIKPSLEQNNQLPNELIEKNRDKISEDIKREIVSNSFDFFSSLFSEKNKKAFAELPINSPREIFDRQSNTYLLKTRTSDQKPGVLESEEYATFEIQAINKLLYSLQNTITATYILPNFVTSEEEKKTDGAVTEDTDGGEVELLEKIKFDEPVKLETFLKKVQEDVSRRVLLNFSDQFAPKFNAVLADLQTNLPPGFLKPVVEAIQEQVEKYIDAEFELLEKDLVELTRKNLYSDEKFNPEILNSHWYEEFISQGVKYITNIPSPNTSYDSFFSYLFETFIYPELEKLKKPSVEPVVVEEKSEKISTAVVPPIIPIVPTAPASQAPILNVEKEEINRLTPQQIRSLQYESAWLYNRAIYELYTFKGMKIEEIPQADLQKLQAEIFNYISSLDIKDFNKLFGSESYRTKTLLEFYQKTGRDIKKIQSSQELLGASLKESLNLDSPVLNENIKNTIDGLIMQYGLNQDFYAFDPTTQTVTRFSGVNEHDFVWFVENMPKDRLALIFNIPANLLASDQAYAKLKEALKNYARYRSSELTLHIQNITLQKGMSIISAKDAAKIKQGDEETINKHMSLTGDLRDMSKAHGGEVVAGAIDEKPNNHRKEIQKQFRTFLPLWENLTGWEQAQIYLNFPDRKIPPQYLTASGKPDRKKLEVTKLEFIPEFIFFDITKLKEIRKLDEILAKAKSDAAKAELKEILALQNSDADRAKIVEYMSKYSAKYQSISAELVEILAIQNQLIREKELADLLNSEYENYSDISEVQEITEYSGVEFKELSFVEKFQADQAIQDAGSTHYEVTAAGYEPDFEETEYEPSNTQYIARRNRPRKRRFLSKFSDSNLGKRIKKRFGIGFKKKFSPFEKVKKAASKAASQVLQKASSLAINVVIPGAGKAVDALLKVIPSQKAKNAISAAILGLVTAVVVRTIWALGSIGGLIGGIIGGVVGYVASGGAMIVPGVIIGANIGELIIPTRWWGSWNKPQTQIATQFAATNEAAAVTAAESAAAAEAAGTAGALASSVVVGATAIGGYGIIIFVTMFIVFVIHSAFLIPVPSENFSVIFNPGDFDDGTTLLDCDEPGPITEFAKNSSSPLASRAFDIVNVLRPGFWCYWNWHPDHDGLDATFTSPSPENPDLFDEVEFAQHPNHCVYNNNYPPGCTGDHRALTGTSLYWCTWLVNQTYQANYNLLASCMSAQFGNLDAVTDNCKPLPGHIFIPIDDVLCTSPSSCNIQPGDTIFTAPVTSGGRVGHVAIVHDIQTDFIRSVDSNASTRDHVFTIGADGKIQADVLPWLVIIGFGRRL